jgi:hypothetical protein
LLVDPNRDPVGHLHGNRSERPGGSASDDAVTAATESFSGIPF